LYKGSSIGVVVPAYNEEKFIAEVVETMPIFVDRIYAVNDASIDNTAKILASIVDDRLTIISHKKRGGAGAAMLSGYKRACEEKMDVIAIMAGDGQMDPAILHKILDPVVDGKADYSKGNRLSGWSNSRGMPLVRLFGNNLLTFVIKIASGYWHISDPLNGYTAVTRNALDSIDLDRVELGYAFETDLLIKLNAANARAANVVMSSRYGDEKSKINLGNFIVYTSWVIVRDYVWRLWTKYSGSRSESMLRGEREVC